MESLSSPPGYGGRYRTMDQAFYILNRVRDPWGDYGDMLTHGMAGRAGDGVLELERTGPFIPPISQPGMPGIVVTDEFRIRVEESSLTGIAFQPVRKTRIVNVPWHDGSRGASAPLHYPKGGEPENYILRLPHHRTVSEQIGTLWELVPRNVCFTTRATSIARGSNDITLVTQDWDGSDIFLAEGVLYHYVTGKARDWLIANSRQFVDFKLAVTSASHPPDQHRR